MTQSGLPTKISQPDGLAAQVTTQSTVPYLISYGGGSEGSGPEPGGYPEYDSIWADMKTQYQDQSGAVNQPLLFLGDEDHSVAFSQCLDQKGYSPIEIDLALRPEQRWD